MARRPIHVAGMARLTIRITHVSWRDGRPRFQPSRQLRDEGWKGQDLRHGPEIRGRLTGAWFSPEECLAWIKIREGEIAERRAEIEKARTAKRRIPTAPTATRRMSLALTVAELFETFFRDNPKMTGQDLVEGKRHQKAAAPATVRFYRQHARALELFDATIYTAPVDALTGPILFDLYERLWSIKGLPTARAVIRSLSAAVSWGMKRGRVRLAVNPCRGLGMEMPEERVRCLTPTEVRQLVAAADLSGRPEIGDAIMLGVWTGQRQIDRLALADGGMLDGRRVFRQTKTKVVVAIRETPELAARLVAAKLRRQAWKVQPIVIVADEQQRRPFKADHYRHTFADVRAAAVAGIRDEDGTERLPPMPSLADVHDQDLRDTAVTWLARAGCTMPEIAQITGHSLQSIQQTLRHYLASHPELADNAIAKVMAWYDAQTQEPTGN